MSFGTPVQGGSGSAGTPVIIYQGQGPGQPAAPAAPAGSGYTYTPQAPAATGYVPQQAQPQQTTTAVGIPNPQTIQIAGAKGPMPDWLCYLALAAIGWGLIGLLRQGDPIHKLKPFLIAGGIYLGWQFFGW